MNVFHIYIPHENMIKNVSPNVLGCYAIAYFYKSLLKAIHFYFVCYIISRAWSAKGFKVRRKLLLYIIVLNELCQMVK